MTKPRIIAIAAVTEDWGIGQNGDQPFYIPGDLQFFRKKTKGKPVVMGRVTLAALPGGRPLPGRTNIILSRGEIDAPGALVCRDLDSLAAALHDVKTDVFVIGGQQIYHAMIDFCHYAYVTKISAKPPADRFFPNLDTLKNWAKVAQGEPQNHNGLIYTFCEYENRHPLTF